MRCLIEFGKYLIAYIGICTTVFINIHIRHMEEKEMEESQWESTAPTT